VRHGLGPNPQFMHASSLERLVRREGHNHSGHTGPNCGCRGACAAVMNDGRHLRKKPAMRRESRTSISSPTFVGAMPSQPRSSIPRSPSCRSADNDANQARSQNQVARAGSGRLADVADVVTNVERGGLRVLVHALFPFRDRSAPAPSLASRSKLRTSSMRLITHGQMNVPGASATPSLSARSR
jgi:hypothetical protein